MFQSFIFALTLFSYLAFSYYFAVRINKEKFLSLWLIFFLVSILLSVEILGAFNVFSASGLLIFALINLGIILLLELRNINKLGKLNLHNIVFDSKGIPVFIILFVLTFLVILYNELSPLTEIDSIAYHLPIVSNLISTNGVWEVFHAGFTGPNTFFPANHEAIQAFFAVLTGNMNFGFVVNLLAFLLLLTSLFDLGNKKISKLFSFIIALCCISVPFLFNQFLNLQIDLFMFCLFSSGVALMVSSVISNDKFDLLKGFLVLGIMLGAKYNSVPQIIVLIPFFIFLFIYHRKSFKSIFWHPFIILLPGIFWYIRNWIIAGNPIYPFGLNLGFINFEGHKDIIAGTVGTSLWDLMMKDGFSGVFNHIFNHSEFGAQLGEISLVLFPAAIFTLLSFEPLSAIITSAFIPIRCIALWLFLITIGSVFSSFRHGITIERSFGIYFMLS